jgi:hypothetical protein
VTFIKYTIAFFNSSIVFILSFILIFFVLVPILLSFDYFNNDRLRFLIFYVIFVVLFLLPALYTFSASIRIMYLFDRQRLTKYMEKMGYMMVKSSPIFDTAGIGSISYSKTIDGNLLKFQIESVRLHSLTHEGGASTYTIINFQGNCQTSIIASVIFWQPDKKKSYKGIEINSNIEKQKIYSLLDKSGVIYSSIDYIVS